MLEYQKSSPAHSPASKLRRDEVSEAQCSSMTKSDEADEETIAIA
jgi:hypothetical protein